MKGPRAVLFCTLLCALISGTRAQVKVEVFYETLNDVVRRFFVEQFKVASDNFVGQGSSQIELSIYPYGNTVKDGTSYICPYGDQQCRANKIHACLIVAETPSTPANSPQNAFQISQFSNCFFKNRFAYENLDDLGSTCLPADGDADWGEIHTCVVQTDNEGITTDYFGSITSDVTAEIIINGLVVRINGIVNNAAKSNFVGEICKALSSSTGICAQTTAPSKVKIGVYYEAFNIDASNYLVRQLGTYFHVLEDFVDIELIPYGNTQFDAGSGSYNCTNDPQCISNKFQALVVDAYINTVKNGHPVSGPNRVVNFLKCYIQSTVANTFQSLEICSNRNLQVDDFQTFLGHIKMDSQEMKTVFESMRTKTQAIAANGLQRIPVVTLNGQVDYNAFDDLVQEACVQYSGLNKAGICTKVNVTVLYEALNHKSRTLFLEQLNPTFDNLYNLINLQMIPAGRAVIVPGNGFVCPGGAEQCDAMKLQACAIDYFWNDGNNYTDPIRQEVFDFIVCTFKNKRMTNVMDTAEVCADQNIELDPWYTIHSCFFDGTANGIFDEYIQETHSIIQNVENHAIPIVLINGNEVTDLTHIKAQVCSFFDAYHAPDYCTSEVPEKVQLQVYYESMNELAKYFFTTQYDPWYIYIEEMASVELFPAGNVVESNLQDGTCDSYDANSVCLANKIQAFVVDQYSKHDDDGDFIDGTLRTMQFLSCYFNHVNFSSNAYEAAEYCSEETLPNDEWFDLLTTIKSPVGNAIYKTVLDATAKFKTDNNIASFDPQPWITLDSNRHSKRAADDLLQTVCSQYTGVDKPLECTPVQVDIYYSAINPQSRRFFLDQLIPTFKALRERIHVDLIPYGLANGSLTIEEECAGREKVCQANKAQACAIDKFFKDEVIDDSIQWDGKNQTLSFITCMFKNMKNLDIVQLAEECGNNNIILADEIIQCTLQPEGQDLLEQMRSKSMSQYEFMDHAPWILINGLRSELAQSDLKQAVCDVMVGDKPNYCYEATPAKVKVEFHYSAVDNKAQSYVISELYPHYRLLEEILDLDVVPFGLTEVLAQGNGGYTLKCPNGVNECKANLIHACVYNQFFHADDDLEGNSQDQREYDGKVQVIEFINCYFHSPKYTESPVDASYQCAEEIFGDIFSLIHMCADTDAGIKILLDFEEKKVATLLPHLTYTPWMTVNGKHNYTIEHHIQRTVCNTYTGRFKPQDCYEIYDSEEKPFVEIHYEIGDSGSNYFFTTALSPDHILEIAQITIVPFGRSTYTDTEQKCVNDEPCQQYKEHACLIDLYYKTEPERTLKTIACTFSELQNDTNVLNECVNQNFEGDIWIDIELCAHQRGDELMKANAQAAQGLMPKISHVPWIHVNGEHNIEAEVSLTNELCSIYFPNDKPAFCLPELIDVAVYYETLNTDVNTFFLDQLSQYTEYLDEIAKFSFIPYGATKNNNGQFTCEKENQCLGNIVHACILNRFFNRSSLNPDSEYEKNRIRFAGFLLCTAFQEESGSTDVVMNAEVCLDRNFEGDFWSNIHFCFAGQEGTTLYAEMARQTAALNPALSSAPVVTISALQNQNAVLNLFQLLCNTYSLVRPPLCATLQSLAVKVGIYFSGNAAGQKYFREQLMPFYEEIVPVLRDSTDEAKLHAVIAPELVAWGDTKYDNTSTDNPFTCAGANECYINRFFACANYYHGSEARATLHLAEFALCFFSQEDAITNPQSAANKCTNRVWIPDPFITLELCATENTQAAYDIFLRMKEKTENNYPHFTAYPAVTINSQRDQVAENNLLEAVCRNYKGYDAPAVCAEYTGSTLAPTTPLPGGSGTTPTISIFILLVSFFICRFIV